MLAIDRTLARAFAYSPINLHAQDKDVRLLTIDPLNSDSDILSLRLHYHATSQVHFANEWAQYVSSISRPISASDRLYWRKEKPGVGRYTWGDYYALSYTWGSPQDTETIYLDGSPFEVTKNLATALRVIREHELLPEGFHVWCDALCINQDDVIERGREVGRMQTIYTRALETIVYLGHGNPSIENAINFIDVTKGCWEDPGLMHQAIASYLQTAPTDVWDHLVDLTNLPYWWRQWVMQEMAAGSEDKPMFYGNTRTTSQEIWSVYSRFNRRNRYRDPASIAFWDALDAFPEHLEKLLKIEPFAKPGPIGMRKFIFANDKSQKWNTYQILSTARKNKCTDPRDHIYGLLGLLDSSLSVEVKVDYNSNHSDVYRDFAMLAISHEKSLEILGQCDINGSPTWTPRFDVNFPWYKHPHHEQEPPMSAHASRAAQVEFRASAKDPGVYDLYTKVVLLGRLDGFTSANLETDFNNENRLYKGGYAEEMRQTRTTNNAYGTLPALKKALWRTAGGNRDVTGAIPGPQSYHLLLSTELLNDTYHFNPNTGPEDLTPNPWASWVKRNADFQIAGHRLVELFSSAGIAEMSEQDRAQAIKDGTDAAKRFTNACWARRIAVTDNGYLSYVPWWAEVDDYVAVFPGCSFPVLLREQKDATVDKPGVRGAFKVVNPCYLHGVMNGEIWSKVDDGEADLEEILLL